MTTDMPSHEELEMLKGKKFQGTSKDFSKHIEILESIGVNKGASLLDYGCSWGYGSWQFGQHGFNVNSFEISMPRAQYALQELHIDVVTNIDEIKGEYDVFFSSHVLEHVPSVSSVLDYAFSILRAGGLFIAFTPNGSCEHRRSCARTWHRLWGFKHPNYLDEVFYQSVFSKMPYIIASSPYDLAELKQWTSEPKQFVGNLTGPELLIVAKKQSDIN